MTVRKKHILAKSGAAQECAARLRKLAQNEGLESVSAIDGDGIVETMHCDGIEAADIDPGLAAVVNNVLRLREEGKMRPLSLVEFITGHKPH